MVLRGFPAPVTPFVERDDELDQLDQLLTSRGERFVTLVGPGGVGKTRLAIEAGRRAAAAFTDGAVFVPLADLDDATYRARAIASALGLEDGAGFDAAELLAAVSQRSLLLVLDNFEHLLAGAGLVSELLAASPGSSVVVTDVDRAGIVRLCRLLEGLPLGLELAAAWMRMLGPDEVADALEVNLDAPNTGHRDVSQRHRSLRTMLDYAWSLLADDERAALAGVAACRGGFLREAAEAVAGTTLPTLLALVNESLLRRSGAWIPLSPPLARYDDLRMLFVTCAADSLVLGTPIWLSERSSTCSRVIERLHAQSGQANEHGQCAYDGTAGGVLVTGNEYRIPHVAMGAICALGRGSVGCRRA